MGLDTVELIMAVEREVEIVLSDDAIARMSRLCEVQDSVAEALQHSGVTLDANEVWERLTGVIRREFRIAPSRLLPEAHIYHDLGLG